MKAQFKAVVAATMALAAASGTLPARADLTYNGEVGLPLNPTAQIPNRDGVRVQANYYDEGSIFGSDFTYYGLGAAGSISDKLEINGAVNRFRVSNSGGLNRTGVAIGAKYLFTRESDPAGVRLAAGVGYNGALLNNTHVYVVGTKYLGTVSGDRAPVTGHLGLRYDRFDEDNFAGKSDKASIYGGVEIPFTRKGDLAFVGELQSKNNDFGFEKIPYSASVRFRQRGRGLSASAGIQRQGLTGESGLFLQLGYSFDTGQITGDDNGNAASGAVPIR